MGANGGGLCEPVRLCPPSPSSNPGHAPSAAHSARPPAGRPELPQDGDGQSGLPRYSTTYSFVLLVQNRFRLAMSFRDAATSVLKYPAVRLLLEKMIRLSCGSHKTGPKPEILVLRLQLETCDHLTAAQKFLTRDLQGLKSG